ncbi:MAG: lysophospholipid acyltransferase family protein [Saprospiraceae bacterium]|nr:lysophospholipid acyltransferase family protein [Saprospiraceae bacterium]
MNMVLLPCFVSQRVIAFYKPISDTTIDNIMLNIRSAFGLELYPIEQTMRVMNHLKDENILYVFIGDQTPLNMNGVYWNTFLHQATPWLTGAEKLAKKYNLPVLYLQQIPETECNISYTLRFHIITENPDHEASGSITEKYSRILENEIIAKPEYWLWSHKRWKRAHHKTID